MAKIRAVVMSVTKERKNALVYTEDGQYLQTRIVPEPAVGSTVLVSVPSPVLLNKKYLAVAAAVLLILFTSLLPQFATAPASAAYLNIAMNRGFELWINHDGKVVQAKIDGADNNDNITGNLKGKTIFEALDRLMQYSSEQGYLNGNKQRLVIGSLITTGSNNIPGLDNSKIKDHICGDLKKLNYSGGVIFTSQTEDLIKLAREADLPLNKYIVYEKLKEKNLSISLQSMRENDVDTVLAAAGIKASDLFGQNYVSMHGMSGGNPSDSTDTTGTDSLSPVPMHNSPAPMGNMPVIQQTMMQQQNNEINNSNGMMPEQQNQSGNSVVHQNSINMNNPMTQSQNNMQIPVQSITQPTGENISSSPDNAYSSDTMSNSSQGSTGTSTNTSSHMGM